VPEIAFRQQAVAPLHLGIEGHVIWLGGDDTLLAKTHLPPAVRAQDAHRRHDALEPRHTLVSATTSSSRSSPNRFSMDAERRPLGVINRFFCEPTWSHE
jgi:hypothetical protein